VTVSLDPYWLRRVAMLAPWQRPGFHHLNQIGHAAALLIIGVGRHSRRKLTFSKHAAHRDHIDGREAAANDGKQFKPGHLRHVEVGKQYVRDFLAKLDQTKWFGTTTDIEDRKRSEILRAELAHVNRISTMGELLASISHELKQPITASAINASTALIWLQHDPPNVNAASEFTGKIIKSSKLAGEIIDRLR